MVKYLMVIIIAATAFLSCKNNKNKPDLAAKKADTSKPFPIAELLKAEIDDVQQTPYFMYIITTTEHKKNRDSVEIKREAFDKIIAPLLHLQLDTNQFKTTFKETAFSDLSTQSTTIITTSLNNKSNFKSVTTLLNDETNKLKSMFFVFNSSNGDTSCKTNYYWKAGKSVTINKVITFNNKILLAETKFVNWNDKIVD